MDPITKERYSRDPRYIAQKAEAYLKSTGIGDTCYMGPEPEFFIFDDVRFDQNSHEGYYHIDSSEGIWNSGRVENPNLGYKPRHKEGYFPVPPIDSPGGHPLRDGGRRCRRSASTSSASTMKWRPPARPRSTSGSAPWSSAPTRSCIFKYIIKNVAKRHNKTVTFMPKPLFGDNGSGMHTHQSIWKGGKPLFAGDEYAGMSQMALHYIGGILKHAKVIAAFTNPTMNSYKRLTPGFEAPVNLAYSSRNRSASVRIPMYSANPKTKRIEVRFPDPSCNPYMAFAAMLMAGLDGIENKIDPGQPLDKDIYDMAPEELASVPSMPGSLEEALDNLEADHDFLMKGDVFTKDAIEMHINYKRTKEVDALRLRPHPYEFFLYYDI